MVEESLVIHAITDSAFSPTFFLENKTRVFNLNNASCNTAGSKLLQMLY